MGFAAIGHRRDRFLFQGDAGFYIDPVERLCLHAGTVALIVFDDAQQDGGARTILKAQHRVGDVLDGDLAPKVGADVGEGCLGADRPGQHAGYGGALGRRAGAEASGVPEPGEEPIRAAVPGDEAHHRIVRVGALIGETDPVGQRRLGVLLAWRNGLQGGVWSEAGGVVGCDRLAGGGLAADKGDSKATMMAGVRRVGTALSGRRG